MNFSEAKPDRDSNFESQISRSQKGLELFRFTSRPRPEQSTFIVGWTKDIGAVSRLASDYLIKASSGSSFCRIEPTGFYPVGGVNVIDDVAQVPQSRFFYSQSRSAVILRADEPPSDKYDFLTAVLDLAQHYAKATALYTINGIAAPTAHTTPRRIFAVFNDVAMQRRLQQFVPADANWQGQPHVSTYLLWLAGQRHLPGVSLWVEVPFYLSDYEDHQSVKVAVSLLSMMLGWELDLGELDHLAADQDDKLAHLEDDPEIREKIRALEDGESLGRQEQKELIEAVGSALKGFS